MRLVAVSVVRNEADIIEAFVRHTLAWVDHHLVFDHASTDGTREILFRLRAEGLALTLFTDDAPGHRQQFRSNHLTRLGATQHAADWVLPLDADEFLAGPGRQSLDLALTATDNSRPVSVKLVDYLCTPTDPADVANPVQRVTHRRPWTSPTAKIFLPRALAIDPACVVGKGSHGCQRGADVVHDEALPDAFHLGHFAGRSASHQILRVVRAELQRLSRGQAAAGLDLHYRLGYQLLAEDPERFIATVTNGEHGLVAQPIEYAGGPLRYTAPTDWSRVAKSLLPYLEELARSHGRLADATGFDPVAASASNDDAVIRELCAEAIEPGIGSLAPTSFSGFAASSGWADAEGPVAEAFLPRFHWGLAPATVLKVSRVDAGRAALRAEVLTYCERQAITVHLNGALVATVALPQVNQKERIALTLELAAGDNELVFSYREALVTAHDPRRLAAIFLSLQIVDQTVSS